MKYLITYRYKNNSDERFIKRCEEIETDSLDSLSDIACCLGLYDYYELIVEFIYKFGE